LDISHNIFRTIAKKFYFLNLLSRANYRGLPTIIYRLGNQAAPINGSNWNPQDFTYLLLLSTLKMNIAPNLGEWEVCLFFNF